MTDIEYIKSLTIGDEYNPHRLFKGMCDLVLELEKRLERLERMLEGEEES